MDEAVARSAITRTKSVEQSIADTDEPDSKLRRDLGVLDLVVFGSRWWWARASSR